MSESDPVSLNGFNSFEIRLSFRYNAPFWLMGTMSLVLWPKRWRLLLVFDPSKGHTWVAYKIASIDLSVVDAATGWPLYQSNPSRPPLLAHPRTFISCSYPITFHLCLTTLSVQSIMASFSCTPTHIIYQLLMFHHLRQPPFLAWSTMFFPTPTHFAYKQSCCHQHDHASLASLFFHPPSTASGKCQGESVWSHTHVLIIVNVVFVTMLQLRPEEKLGTSL